MEQNILKKFAALDADVLCQCKTITQPLGFTPYFHNHDGCEILLILGGMLDFYTESGGARLERGDLVCINEYDFHRADVVTKGQYDRIVINVRHNHLARISTSRTDFTACFQPNPLNPIKMTHLSEDKITELSGYAQALEESLAQEKIGDELVADAFLKLIMVMIVRQFLKQGVPGRTNIVPWLVAETFSYIEDHLSEEITLKKLEEHVHHNGTYISRCFKQITGITLQQFIIAKKIMLSCRLLREGNAPCDVCYMTGFNNYSNYSRTFSKQMGISPKKYQIENR